LRVQKKGGEQREEERGAGPRKKKESTPGNIGKKSHTKGVFITIIGMGPKLWGYRELFRIRKEGEGGLQKKTEF